MKKGIHPKYKKTTIKCACGEVIETSSTKEDINVEICSKCHPFFTGKQKLVDSAGRVEKFKRKYAKTKTKSKKQPAPEKSVPEVSNNEEAQKTDDTGSTQ